MNLITNMAMILAQAPDEEEAPPGRPEGTSALETFDRLIRETFGNLDFNSLGGLGVLILAVTAIILVAAVLVGVLRSAVHLFKWFFLGDESMADAELQKAKVKVGVSAAIVFVPFIWFVILRPIVAPLL